MSKEYNLQKSICEYLRLQYPNVLFTSSMDGVKLPIGLAVKQKILRSCRGWPDIFICHPSNGYSGLFLEVKADSCEIFKKSGDFKTDHVKEQNMLMTKLNDLGFKAYFVWTFEGSKMLIDQYFKVLTPAELAENRINDEMSRLF